MPGSMCILGGKGWLTRSEELILQRSDDRRQYGEKKGIMRYRTVNPWRAMTFSSCSFVFATLKLKSRSESSFSESSDASCQVVDLVSPHNRL